MFSRQPQGHFAQGGQIADAKEIVGRRLTTFGGVNFPFGQPFAQLFRGEVDQFNFIGQIEERIRHRFGHRNAGNLPHGIGPALKVLDIDRGIDINASVEEFNDILIAFAMAAAWHIGMGKFIDDNQPGATGQDRIQIQLFEEHAAIIQVTTRDAFNRS